MRWVWVALVLAVLGSGCSTNKAAGPEPGLAKGRAGKAGTHSAAQSSNASKAMVSPDEEWFGRVVSANPVLRFVVMDFPVSRMPPVEQRLNVYHRGQKVGEVKVTGPMRDTTIAGDIIAGEAQVGDEVRER